MMATDRLTSDLLSEGGTRAKVERMRAWVAEWLKDRFLDDCECVRNIHLDAQWRSLGDFEIVPGILWKDFIGDAAPNPPGHALI